MRKFTGLFRGKRLGTGEWIEGYFAPALEKDSYSIYDIEYPEFGYYVDPDTVGECTGLTDKNGKLIFEGDIVKLEGKELPFWYNEGDCVEVEYDGCGFNSFAEYDSDCGAYVSASLCAIIGNIHDNPEILEGGVN